MTRYGMIIDITRCNGCYNCFLTCRDEYYGNDFPPYSLAQPFRGQFWMHIFEKERGQYPQSVKVAYIPTPCMQCDDANCIKASSNGEVYRRPDGTVIIDPEKARGKKEIVSSCPYRVIYWNEEKQIPQKCTFCAHLLNAGWKEPRCVEACPTGALIFGDLDDPDSEVSRTLASRKTEVMHPEYEMRDKVRYIGLPKRSIAGSVIFGDTDECADGASVTIVGEETNTVVTTNNFGDFEIDGLPLNKEFIVKIKHTQYQSVEYNVMTNADVYLGDVVLNRREKAKRK